MGIEDRDYFRERKFSWVTGELIEPDKDLKPLEPLTEFPTNPNEYQRAQMGLQDRDYMRERKLDYSSKYDSPRRNARPVKRSSGLPAWLIVVLLFVGTYLVVRWGMRWR